MRRELQTLTAVTIRHHPESAIAAMLLMGWLASRLGWRLEPSGGARRRADGQGQRGAARTSRCALLRRPSSRCAGSRALELETASGLRLRLDRGPGGLHAYRARCPGGEREWTLLGASRGEAGILGEGIRQALLRDPTYAPALAAAGEMPP